MGEVLERFPLFPLAIVCLPGEVVPLHIFEERYKTMIGECLAEERPFGIVWLGQRGLSEVGCMVEITEVLDRMPDGRLNILVAGRVPFRLLARVDDLPYPAGDIELLEDEDDDVDDEAAARARERYGELLERATDTRPDEARLEELGAYEMAATIDLGPDVKQDLLEERSEGARMRALADLLEEALRRIELVEDAGERARSNGKVRR